MLPATNLYDYAFKPRIPDQIVCSGLMDKLTEKVNALNKLISDGNTLQAMELFYAEEVEMQENEDPPRKGKSICMDAEGNNLKSIKNVDSRLLNQAIDKHKNVVFSEWEIWGVYNNGHRFLLKQVSVQHWSEGKIAREKFYYQSVQAVD